MFLFLPQDFLSHSPNLMNYRSYPPCQKCLWAFVVTHKRKSVVTITCFSNAWKDKKSWSCDLKMWSNENRLLFTRSVYCKASVTPTLLVLTTINTFPPYNTNNYIVRRVWSTSHYNLSDSLYLVLQYCSIRFYSEHSLSVNLLPILMYSTTSILVLTCILKK